MIAHPGVPHLPRDYGAPHPIFQIRPGRCGVLGCV